MPRNSAGKSRLDATIKRHGGGRGALIPALQTIQREQGYLPEESLAEISAKLGLTHSNVLDIVEFYDEFRLQKRGRHVVKVCDGTACHLAGSEMITDMLQEELKVSVGKTTADRKFTLETTACLGCCVQAPAMAVDGKAYGALTLETARRAVRQRKRRGHSR